jgi:DNA-binding CsgD family transcriptional regulator
MTEDTSTQRSTSAKRLAILGALITGTAGVTMAVYSIVIGEETGAGALLASSALAFGLLAANVDRAFRRPGSQDVAGQVEVPGDASHVGTAVQHASTPVTENTVSPLNASSMNGGLALHPQQARAEVAQIDAEPLTPRERQVLSLVAEGYSNKLISAELVMSERTVKNHLTATMTKLRASDRTHAVVTAVRLGWLEI